MSKADIIQKIQDIAPTMPNAGAIKRIRLFGSYVHDTATEESDVDLLVDFDVKKEPVGLFELIQFQQRFEDALQKSVDFVPSDSLNKRIQERVNQEAETIYEQV